MRKPRYAVKTQQRQKPENRKEELVKEKGYKNIRLTGERVAEFEYQQGKCEKICVGKELERGKRREGAI